MPIAPPDESSGYASHNGKGRHVPRYDSAGSDNTAFPNCNAWQQYRTRTNIRLLFHSHRADLKISFDNWPVERKSDMERPQSLRSRAPSHMILKNQISRIEVRLRTNPHVIPDFCTSIKAPLYIGLSPNKHAVPDLKRLQVFESNTTFDPNSVPKLPADHPPNSAAH